MFYIDFISAFNILSISAMPFFAEPNSPFSMKPTINKFIREDHPDGISFFGSKMAAGSAAIQSNLKISQAAYDRKWLI